MNCIFPDGIGFEIIVKRSVIIFLGVILVILVCVAAHSLYMDILNPDRRIYRYLSEDLQEVKIFGRID